MSSLPETKKVETEKPLTHAQRIEAARNERAARASTFPDPATIPTDFRGNPVAAHRPENPVHKPDVLVVTGTDKDGNTIVHSSGTPEGAKALAAQHAARVKSEQAALAAAKKAKP